MANKEQSIRTCAKHDDWLMVQLADAEFAAEYLNAASEDDDPASYLAALRKVVEARGGIAVVAEKTHLSRETLYRTLSQRSWRPGSWNTMHCMWPRLSWARQEFS